MANNLFLYERFIFIIQACRFSLILVIFSFVVPAKAHVALDNVHLKVQVTGAGWSLNVPKKGCAMEPHLCVLPRNQKQTSPCAIQKHKSASMVYVVFLILLPVEVTAFKVNSPLIFLKLDLFRFYL